LRPAEQLVVMQARYLDAVWRPQREIVSMPSSSGRRITSRLNSGRRSANRATAGSLL